MNNPLTKIALFTLSACPIGRSMGTVLREVAALFPEMTFETIYVELQVEETNRYRVKTNPTTLFLDRYGKELYRLEGFRETDEVINVMAKINKDEIMASGGIEENQATIEKYIVYLYRGELLVPVEVEHKNFTSVKAPRITVVNLLIQAQIEGLENPFPPGTTLELVQFKDKKGYITLNLKADINSKSLAKMKGALIKTLSHFGLETIELLFS
ncbi:MAG: GerMN domain-containing protein [Desulfitobacteriaceae bacterium]